MKAGDFVGKSSKRGGYGVELNLFDRTMLRRIMDFPMQKII